MTTTSEQGTFTLDIRKHLIRSGVIDAKGINARPRPRRCACGAPVLAAWANGNMPTITVDPIALTPLGELQALLAGRTTWQDWGDGLDQRRPRDIDHLPAGADKSRPVRPKHECNARDVFDSFPRYVGNAFTETPPF